jgi:uncharacterized SAM-binding protein YcdF (DUF218 family)
LLSQIPFSNLFLYPPSLGLLFLLVAVLCALWSYKRIAILLSALGLSWILIWSLPITSLYFGGKLEKRYSYEEPARAPRADVIVVLGGNTQSNRANWFEPYNRATALDRIDRAAALYFAGRAPKILLSGGALEGKVSEARIMARALRQRGVPESALILENDSRHTYENAQFSDRMMQSAHLKRALLVTSALHMPRALATFIKRGIDAIPAPSAPQITLPDDEQLNPWLPHIRSLEASRTIIKEYLGLLGYWLRGWV